MDSEAEAKTITRFIEIFGNPTQLRDDIIVAYNVLETFIMMSKITGTKDESTIISINRILRLFDIFIEV